MDHVFSTEFHSNKLSKLLWKQGAQGHPTHMAILQKWTHFHMSSKEHLQTLVTDVGPSSSGHKLKTAMYFHLEPQISADFFTNFL